MDRDANALRGRSRRVGVIELQHVGGLAVAVKPNGPDRHDVTLSDYRIECVRDIVAIVRIGLVRELSPCNGCDMPAPVPFEVWTDGLFLHGTKADLKPGDLIEPGRPSNYAREPAAFVYLTATLDAATWGAELAIGDGRGRIYIVEPTGPIEDDPELTDKKFPGNPTRSFRTTAPLRVTGEILEWEGHAPEQLAATKARIARLTRKD